MKHKLIFKNYIITAHKEPDQLRRLIDQLNDHNSTFYIHIDLKVNLHPFKKIINMKNVVFIKERVNCIWGDYSQVKATLNLLKNVLQNSNKGRVIFLSGQDYPIKKQKYIDDYLRKNSHYEFINYTLNPIGEKTDLYNQRINKYKFNLSDKRGDFILLPTFLNLSKKEIKLIVKLILINKTSLFNIFPIFNVKRKSIYKKNYKGTNWWSFRYDTAEKIYNYYYKNKKELDNYYKFTICADEQFFHTILKEIIKKHTSIKILPNLHFIDWNRKNVPLPVTFKKDDLNLLIEQKENKLFARKFDYDIDKEILDLIDKNIT